MISRARPRRGVPMGPGMGIRQVRDSRHAFTLLEMCIVLFIMVLFLGAMTPAIQSMLTEQAVRNDSRQISYLVRSAMLQSGEQHRPFVLDITSSTLDLHSLGTIPKVDENKDGDAATEPDDVGISRRLDPSNKLLVPDPKKTNSWIAMPPTSWLFHPGELCPASRIRLARGNAWVEMSFNALTGNVEDEAAYFP